MPIYQYHCKENHDKVGREVFYQSSPPEKPTYRCPECGKDMKRTYSPFSVIYHGGGFTGASKR
jgi:putative FmdB family regulatory protein